MKADERPTPSQPPRIVRRILTGLYAGCAFFLLLDLGFFLFGFDKHPYLRWEKWPGFYGVFAFVACVLLVLVARFLLRPLVMRREDYYENPSTESGEKTDA